MNRCISAFEAAVVQWLLEHAAVGDVTPYRIPLVHELKVLKGCECGCSSLDFQPDAWTGADIIADAVAVYPDGRQAGLILWGRGGEIVCWRSTIAISDASQRFPEVSNLQRLEAH